MDIQGKLFLAPMAGTADYAFRSICRSLGADIVCSEMVSAKATLYGDRKSAELAFLRDDERPAGIQLFGSEPDVMAKAAERVAVYRPLYIDINMGCPVHKVFANGEGSALMRDVPKAAALIRARAGRGRRARRRRLSDRPRPHARADVRGEGRP